MNKVLSPASSLKAGIGRLKLDLSPPQSIDLVISADKTKGFKEWLAT